MDYTKTPLFLNVKRTLREFLSNNYEQDMNSFIFSSDITKEFCRFMETDRFTDKMVMGEVKNVFPFVNKAIRAMNLDDGTYAQRRGVYGIRKKTSPGNRYSLIEEYEKKQKDSEYEEKSL